MEAAHDPGDAMYALHYFADGRAGFVGQAAASRDICRRSLDQGLDLARRSRAALGEAADLGGNDGEAATLLSGAGCLDGSVQRQQVGLKGDSVDHAGDFGNLMRGLTDAVHRMPKCSSIIPRDW